MSIKPINKRVIKKIIKKSSKHSDSNDKYDKMLSVLAEYLIKTPKKLNQPPFLEIGTRGGGSALLMLKIIEKKFKDSFLITVDPYGDKPYDDKPWTYGEDFYKEMKKILSSYGNHIHYYMTSEDFLSIMDSINFWHQGKKKNFSKFSFVFLDGSHLPQNVKMEFKILFPRLIKGGYMVVDNTDYFDNHLRNYFDKLTLKNNSMKVSSTDIQSIIHKIK